MNLIGDLHQFSDEQDADPTEVNANFDEVKTKTNANLNAGLKDENHADIVVDDEDTTTGLTDKPGNLFSRLFTKIKDILGTTSVFDSVPIDLSTVNSRLNAIDNDNDGIVDKADTANLYKSNDIDSDGDGIVDKADYANDGNATTYKGNDIDTDGDGKVDNAVQADSANNADKIGNAPPPFSTINDLSDLTHYSGSYGTDDSTSIEIDINGSGMILLGEVYQQYGAGGIGYNAVIVDGVETQIGGLIPAIRFNSSFQFKVTNGGDDGTTYNFWIKMD